MMETNNVNDGMAQAVENTAVVWEQSQSDSAQKIIEPLMDMFFEIESSINDNKSVYCGSKITPFDADFTRKLHNAYASYAHNNSCLGKSDEQKLHTLFGLEVALIDITLFGSARDGFVITEQEICAKPFLGARYYIKLSDVVSIDLDEKQQEIVINRTDRISYTHSELTKQMRAVVNCIKAYQAQF
jgi:hypothetical protein